MERQAVKVEHTQLYIDGKFVDGVKGEKITVVNPGNEEVICEISAATEEDVNLAVEAALRALPAWKKISVEEKQVLFYKAAQLIEEELETLIALECMDNGKPYSEGEFDIKEVANGMRYYGGWIPNVCGRTYTTTNEYTVQTRKEPCGVVALIAPWNYPLLMDAWKFCPALAAGNTVVLKPSEETPLSVLKLASIFEKAGFPPGVFNVVPGYGHTAGEALARHMKVDKISFTGSTIVGRKIMEASAQSNLKKIHLELGGKAPVLIFNDANVDRTVEWLWNAAFFTSGQNCCQGSRIYCEKGIYPTIVKRLSEMAKDPKVCKVGYWSEEGVNMGPIANRRQFEKVMSYIDIGKNKEKLNLVAGGNRARDKGFFVEPTIFADVPETSQLCKDEIFGPVLCLMEPFDSIDSALFKANDTVYGLACGVFTENHHKAERCVRELKFGNVWVNNYNMNPFWAPFGGFKQSGFGKDNGEDGVQEYTITKTVYYKYDDMY